MRGWQPGRGARPGRKLREPWLASLRAEGLDGSGAAFQVQGATAAGNYVGKWGAAEELALSGKKSGRAGRSPFPVAGRLRRPERRQGGSPVCGVRWRVQGSPPTGGSPGLKKLAGIDEVSDEQAAEDAVRMADESKHDERVGHFTPKGWSVVRRHRAALLKFAEPAGAAGVDAVVQASKPPPPPPLPTGKPGAGACVAVQAAQGPQARGSGGSMHPSGGAP